MRLKAEHISYKYPGGSREVLSDVSLELGSTDRLGIAAVKKVSSENWPLW